jgi:hypothetical protein
MLSVEVWTGGTALPFRPSFDARRRMTHTRPDDPLQTVLSGQDGPARGSLLLADPGPGC